MTETELAAAVAKLGSTQRTIYELALKEGPVIVARMREITGHADGHTSELKRLRSLGLIRQAGLKPNWTRGGPAPMQYVAVPAAEVEREAAAAAAEKPPKKKKRPPTDRPDAEHLARLRAAEEQGGFEDYYRGRRKMVDLMRSFAWFENAIDWDCIPEGETTDVAREFAMLEHSLVRAKAALLVRKGDDADRAKIEIMLDENGRTAEEAAAFKRGAERLARKLPQKRVAKQAKKAPTLATPNHGTVRASVLDALTNAYPEGLTDEELAVLVERTHSGLAASSIRTRRSELEDDGWVEKAGIKRKTASGRREADVYRLTVGGAAKLGREAA